MTDPRDYSRDPRLNEVDPRYRDDPGVESRSPARAEAEARNTMWGWVAGIIAAIFIVAIVYGFANNNGTTTATNTPNQPAATGSATTGSGSARPPSETTGSGTSTPTPQRQP